mmetsp:Transcript_6767/g.16546  ORF Transcript_6767/g.16546 Transcript_6767/m.16546 type:complete len:1880 (-) Transcript_6767:458-6097(-)
MNSSVAQIASILREGDKTFPTSSSAGAGASPTTVHQLAMFPPPQSHLNNLSATSYSAVSGGPISGGGSTFYPTYSEAVVHATLQMQLDLCNHRCTSMVSSVQRQVEMDRREIERAVGLLEGKLEARIEQVARAAVGSCAGGSGSSGAATVAGAGGIGSTTSMRSASSAAAGMNVHNQHHPQSHVDLQTPTLGGDGMQDVIDGGGSSSDAVLQALVSKIQTLEDQVHSLTVAQTGATVRAQAATAQAESNNRIAENHRQLEDFLTTTVKKIERSVAEKFAIYEADMAKFDLEIGDVKRGLKEAEVEWKTGVEKMELAPAPANNDEEVTKLAAKIWDLSDELKEALHKDEQIAEKLTHRVDLLEARSTTAIEDLRDQSTNKNILVTELESRLREDAEKRSMELETRLTELEYVLSSKIFKSVSDAEAKIEEKRIRMLEEFGSNNLFSTAEDVDILKANVEEMRGKLSAAMEEKVELMKKGFEAEVETLKNGFEKNLGDLAGTVQAWSELQQERDAAEEAEKANSAQAVAACDGKLADLEDKIVRQTTKISILPDKIDVLQQLAEAAKQKAENLEVDTLEMKLKVEYLQEQMNTELAAAAEKAEAGVEKSIDATLLSGENNSTSKPAPAALSEDDVTAIVEAKLASQQVLLNVSVDEKVSELESTIEQEQQARMGELSRELAGVLARVEEAQEIGRKAMDRAVDVGLSVEMVSEKVMAEAGTSGIVPTQPPDETTTSDFVRQSALDAACEKCLQDSRVLAKLVDEKIGRENAGLSAKLANIEDRVVGLETSAAAGGGGAGAGGGATTLTTSTSAGVFVDGLRSSSLDNFAPPSRILDPAEMSTAAGSKMQFELSKGTGTEIRQDLQGAAGGSSRGMFPPSKDSTTTAEGPDRDLMSNTMVTNTAGTIPPSTTTEIDYAATGADRFYSSATAGHEVLSSVPFSPLDSDEQFVPAQSSSLRGQQQQEQHMKLKHTEKLDDLRKVVAKIKELEQQQQVTKSHPALQEIRAICEVAQGQIEALSSQVGDLVRMNPQLLIGSGKNSPAAGAASRTSGKGGSGSRSLPNGIGTGLNSASGSCSADVVAAQAGLLAQQRLKDILTTASSGAAGVPTSGIAVNAGAGGKTSSPRLVPRTATEDQAFNGGLSGFLHDDDVRNSSWSETHQPRESSPPLKKMSPIEQRTAGAPAGASSSSLTTSDINEQLDRDLHELTSRGAEQLGERSVVSSGGSAETSNTGGRRRVRDEDATNSLGAEADAFRDTYQVAGSGSSAPAAGGIVSSTSSSTSARPHFTDSMSTVNTQRLNSLMPIRMRRGCLADPERVNLEEPEKVSDDEDGFIVDDVVQRDEDPEVVFDSPRNLGFGDSIHNSPELHLSGPGGSSSRVGGAPAGTSATTSRTSVSIHHEQMAHQMQNANPHDDAPLTSELLNALILDQDERGQPEAPERAERSPFVPSHELPVDDHPEEDMIVQTSGDDGAEISPRARQHMNPEEVTLANLRAAPPEPPAAVEEVILESQDFSVEDVESSVGLFGPSSFARASGEFVASSSSARERTAAAPASGGGPATSTSSSVDLTTNRMQGLFSKAESTMNEIRNLKPPEDSDAELDDVLEEMLGSGSGSVEEKTSSTSPLEDEDYARRQHVREQDHFDEADDDSVNMLLGAEEEAEVEDAFLEGVAEAPPTVAASLSERNVDDDEVSNAAADALLASIRSNAEREREKAVDDELDDDVNPLDQDALAAFAGTNARSGTTSSTRAALERKNSWDDEDDGDEVVQDEAPDYTFDAEPLPPAAVSSTTSAATTPVAVFDLVENKKPEVNVAAIPSGSSGSASGTSGAQAAPAAATLLTEQPAMSPAPAESEEYADDFDDDGMSIPESIEDDEDDMNLPGI